ncbi:MAG: type II toxin-antitoxin system VapC family toxin [Bacteroidia bacterium]
MDTHTVIWFIINSSQLSAQAKQLIENGQNTCYISIASYWEIAIKYARGRLELNAELEKIFDIIDESGFEILPITPKHILKNAELEFHHQDPFDRIIIAQALVEKLTIVGKDNQFTNYGIQLVW